MIILKNNKGQSLLEMVFAIGVLMIAVSAILALATSNVIGQKESESQIIANNLAREAIEVVRNIRDSNWLAGQNWDTGLIGSGFAIPVFDPNLGQWQPLVFSAQSNAPVSITRAGVYNQSNQGERTSYNRYLRLESICLGSSGREYIQASCDPGDGKVGLKVEAFVSWLDRGQRRQVKLEDLLYAWK